MFGGSYGTKFLFTWESVNGALYTINLQKSGYNGDYATRRLGRAPVLRMKNNGNIYGTSLEFYAECQTEGEFSELYTTTPFEFRVTLTRKTGNATVEVWTGYVSPELYSAPDIAPPYDVDIIATDGIGELKLTDFAGYGLMSLDMIFKYLLSVTHNGLPRMDADVPPTVKYLSSLLSNTPSVARANFFSDIYINLDYKKGETLYDLLQYLLDTLHAGITFFRGYWLVFRETDFRFTGNNAYLWDNSTVAGTQATVGQMGVAVLWPVGNTVTKVEPAKNAVTVEAPAEYYTPVKNSEMNQDSDWSISGARNGESSAFNATELAYKVLGSGSMGNLWQSITGLDLSVATGFKIKSCCAFNISGDSFTIMVSFSFLPSGYTSWADAFTLYDRGGNLVWLKHSEWTLDDIKKYGVFGAFSSTPSGLIGSPVEGSGTLPPFEREGYSQTGTLRIQVSSYGAFVYSFFLGREFGKGFKDTVRINNGARGEASKVEIAVGRETSDLLKYKDFMRGILLNGSGALITSLSDNSFTSLNFLSLISRGYALSVALPRLKLTGTLNVPAALIRFPLLLSKDGIKYRFLSYSWDLVEDEIEVEALSLPAATLEVNSETITSLTGSGSSAASEGGSASGGAVAVSGLSLSDVQSYLDRNGYINEVTSEDITDALGYTPATPAQLATKQDTISDLTTIRSNAQAGASASAALPTLSSRVTTLESAVANLSADELAPAPRLFVRTGVTSQGLDANFFFIKHGCLGISGCEAVLMIYRPRNGRRTFIDSHDHKHWTYKKGWAVALGDRKITGHTTALTVAGSTANGGTAAIALGTLKDFIVKRFMVWDGYTKQQLFNMTYEDWRQGSTGRRGFAGRHASYGTCYKRFGIAIRYTNPEFTALVDDSRALSEDPQEIAGKPRYPYSAVAPLEAYLVNLPRDPGNYRQHLYFGVLWK